MTLSELITVLSEIVEKNPEVGATVEVMIRQKGHMEFEPIQVTLTYVSKRRQGTTVYDQDPVVLLEPKEDENERSHS